MVVLCLCIIILGTKTAALHTLKETKLYLLKALVEPLSSAITPVTLFRLIAYFQSNFNFDKKFFSFKKI
jgi:hypothetical protein